MAIRNPDKVFGCSSNQASPSELREVQTGAGLGKLQGPVTVEHQRMEA